MFLNRVKISIFVLSLFLTSLFGQEKADPFAVNQALGRGVNLGNALEAPSLGEWGVILEERYFQLISSAGFNSVRIPVRFSAHALAASPYTIDETFFDEVDWAIDMASKYGLYAILDLHHYLELMTDPANNKERFLALWGQISDRYKDYSDSLLFEILNEPNDQLNADLWNQYLAEAISNVRQANPGRTLVIGTAEWGSLNALNKLVIPEGENNVIVTFHYYNPFQFTHQGAEWVSGSDAWLGTTWTATQQEKLDVSHEFDNVMVWGLTHNRPIFLGEFGAYSKAEMTYRAKWTEYVSRQAENRNFSWSYWEFCAGFGVFDRGVNDWNTPLLNALIPETVGIEEKGDILLPNQPELYPNYPNPFNPKTRIRYLLNRPGSVSLNIYSAEGKRLSSLVKDEYQNTGMHFVDFNGNNFASGLYICRLSTSGANVFQKMILLK